MLRNEVINKITKLLALAERGGTVEEAETAMRKAKELLSKYNLSLGDISVNQNTDCEMCVIEIKGKLVFAYELTLQTAMMVLYDCKGLWAHNRGNGTHIFRFIGVEADGIIAGQTFQFLIESAKRGAKKVGKKGYNSYLIGFAEAIKAKALKIKRTIETVQETALVPFKDATINKWIAENIGRVKKHKYTYSVSNGDGYAKGYSDGSKVDFNRPVNNAQSTLAIN